MTRIATAASEAAKIIKAASITTPNEIPLEELISFIDGPIVRYEPMEGCEGKLISYLDISVIKISDKIMNVGRKRFTLAHELGHYMLHRDKKYICCSIADLFDWQGNNWIETEANYFAAELLMPSEIFSKESKKNKFSKSNLISLAALFNTSLTSTAIRYTQAGNEPIIIIYAQNGNVKWILKNEALEVFIDYKNLRKIPVNTVTDEFLAEGTIYNEGEEINIFDWDIKPDYNGLRFKEEVIDLKFNKSTLTLLYTF
jgi:Zn-dependent peptidase ImmA (M78 family)